MGIGVFVIVPVIVIIIIVIGSFIVRIISHWHWQ